MSRADSTWRDKSWRKQALMHSKRKIPDSWCTGWKEKACKSFALCLKVFKNHLYYLWLVRVLSFKPCLHTQLPERNRSYWKVSRGLGHLITWNGPMMGYLTSFSASGGEGVARGMFKLPFDWYIVGGGGYDRLHSSSTYRGLEQSSNIKTGTNAHTPCL